MQRHFHRLLKSLGLRLFAVATPFMCTAITLAQSAPPPNARKVPPVWLGYLIIFVLAVLVLLVSMMPSKRSHQD